MIRDGFLFHTFFVIDLDQPFVRRHIDILPAYFLPIKPFILTKRLTLPKQKHHPKFDSHVKKVFRTEMADSLDLEGLFLVVRSPKS